MKVLYLIFKLICIIDFIIGTLKDFEFHTYKYLEICGNTK